MYNSIKNKEKLRDEDIIKASIHALTVAVNKLPQIAQNDEYEEGDEEEDD